MAGSSPRSETMATLDVAVLPGDGVGPEVTHAALDVLRAVTDLGAHRLQVAEWPLGWAAIREGEEALPARTLEACRAADAVLLGAVGGPADGGAAGDERPVAGLLDLRAELGCHANLRPIRVSEGLISYSSLRPTVVRGTDILIVRELAGGLYYGTPRGMDRAAGRAWNTLAYGAEEVRRIARTAFELARARSLRLTSVDKANVLEASSFWRTIVTEVATEFPDVALDHMLVDRAALELLTRPRRFDTILTSNLFGDILSDGAAALVGSLGPLGSASLGGETDIYEPVHGSAPDIAGRGTANPIGAISSASLMLRHSFGFGEEADIVDGAVERALVQGHRTADLDLHGADGVLGEEHPVRAPIGTAAFTDRVVEGVHRSA